MAWYSSFGYLYSDRAWYVEADPCYAAFHDEEWGLPVHDDKYVIATLFASMLIEMKITL